MHSVPGQRARTLISLRRWWVCFTWVALAWIAPTYATTVAGLYDTSVRITDQSEAARQAAFGTALGIVATRVSGRTDAPAKLAAAAGSAQRYVQRFGYNNGQLEVGFDSNAVNALLEQAGLPLWGRERPVTVVVFPGALQGLREARAAVEQTAKLRGVPIVWANGETSEQFSNATPQQLQTLAGRYAAAGVLLAQVNEPVTAANLRWRFAFNGALQEMPGAAEQGPNLAADVMGRYYAVAAKDAASVVLEISGIDELGGYANTLNYLSTLSIVRSVQVESLQRDVVRFRVELRGNADALKRAIELDRRILLPAAAAADGDAAALVYRYNPAADQAPQAN